MNASDVKNLSWRVRRSFVEKEVANALIAHAPNDDPRFILFCGLHAGFRGMGPARRGRTGLACGKAPFTFKAPRGAARETGTVVVTQDG